MIEAQESARDASGSSLWTRSGLKWQTQLGLCLGTAALLCYYVLSPKLTYNDGYGWDGQQYARWVSTLLDELASGEMTTYYVGRILPSLLVSLPARLFHLPITRDYIIYGFCVANALCAYLTSLFWLRACAVMQVSSQRALLGLVFLILNSAMTRQSAYWAVLTDAFALAAAAVMLDAWLRGRTGVLALAVLASMFCWPSTHIVGSLLLLFPRGSRLHLGRFARFAPWLVALATGAFALLCIAAAAIIFIKNKNGGMPVPTWRNMLPLSIAIAVAYAWVVAKNLIHEVLRDPSTGSSSNLPLISGMRRSGVLLWFCCVPLVLAVQHVVAPKTFGLALSSGTIVLGAINRPGLFLVGHATYYGGLALFVALFLPRVIEAASSLGLGMLGVVSFGLLLSLYPESRMTLNVVPFVAMALVLALRFERLSAAQWAFVGALQFAVCKVWLPTSATAVEFSGSLQAYPAQYAFVSSAPWMANDAFLIQGAVMICAAIVGAILFERTPRLLRGTVARPAAG